MRLNVTSETGRLKRVLVHEPGREIDLMVPPMMAQLLFDDILYGQVAREEHRRFQQIIRYVAEEIYEIKDLLEEIFEDEKIKKRVVRDLAVRNKLGRKLVKWLLDRTPADLADVLISGIPNERESSGQLPKFDLFPVPNLFFMRDPQVVIGDRVVICSMATQARRREALLSDYVFRYHRLFRDRATFLLDFMHNKPERPIPKNAPTLEGGDIIVARRDVLLVGLTERTNKAAITQLAAALKEADSGVKTIIVAELPRQRSFMHLDTVFTFTSGHECLIYPPVILPGGSEAAKVTTLDLTNRTTKATEQKSLLKALKKVDMDFEPIHCGGKRAVDQQREQWTDGANAFALAPGIIMLYERNVRTAEQLAHHDYHIIYEDDLLLGRVELETWTDKKYAIQIQGNELSRARGGPRCMTMPLEREDV